MGCCVCALLIRRWLVGACHASMRSAAKGTSAVAMRACVHSCATAPSSVILHAPTQQFIFAPRLCPLGPALHAQRACRCKG